MSTPAFSTLIGMPSRCRILPTLPAAAEHGTIMLLPEMSKCSACMSLLKWTAYLTALPTSLSSVLAFARLDMSSTC